MHFHFRRAGRTSTDEGRTLIQTLLAGKDSKLLNRFRNHLESQGLSVSVVEQGHVALHRILNDRPDLVVLDMNLPDLDALDVCRSVRDDYPGLIIVLASNTDEIDQIAGLEVGADDYLIKPVSPRLLLARIKVLLRRNPRFDNEEISGTKIEVGDMLLVPSSSAAYIDGRKLDLTNGEYELLLLLARSAGEPVRRDTLHQRLRGAEWDGLDRSVDQRVKRLRRKLGDCARDPRWIKSVRGTGYMLANG